VTEEDSHTPERAQRAPATQRPKSRAGADLPPVRSRSHRAKETDGDFSQGARARRSERAERLAHKRTIARNRILAVVGAVVLVTLLGAAAVLALGRNPGPGRTPVVSSAVGKTAKASKRSSTNHQTNTAGETVSTPAFARIGPMLIYLPVSVKALTAVMFHQSARGKSYDMTSLVPDVDRAKIFRMVKGGAKLPIASSAVGTSSVDHRDGEQILDSVWKGAVVRVYRTGRVGLPASAADVGAKSGTVVVAPISGTVMRVKSYRLYGKYFDYEVHIKPDAMTQADLVVIHVSDVLVNPGDWVIGGVSPIAHVRRLSTYMKHQLGEYTGELGDHTHIQFNRPSSGPEETPSS